MKKFLVIISFLFLIFYAEKTYACSCLAPDPNKSLKQQVTEAFGTSSAVFTAEVMSISENSTTGISTVTLKLTKSWKGKLVRKLNLTTASNSAACGYNFEVGKTYLIYAFSGGNKKLNTNICTRTAEITVTKDVAVLNKIKKKT